MGTYNFDVRTLPNAARQAEAAAMWNSHGDTTPLPDAASQIRNMFEKTASAGMRNKMKAGVIAGAGLAGGATFYHKARARPGQVSRKQAEIMAEISKADSLSRNGSPLSSYQTKMLQIRKRMADAGAKNPALAAAVGVVGGVGAGLFGIGSLRKVVR